jgi:hypothetical protein
MSERVIKLGIDYGTSFSKIVYRDYGAAGGDKAYVLLNDGKFRIPSAIGIANKQFIFGIDPSRRREGGTTWHESVKMRVAGELKNNFAKYCYGLLLPLPSGFSATDLAVLSVAYLINRGKEAIRAQVRTSAEKVVVAFTLGIPMSFFDDGELRSRYLKIARTAWALSKTLDIEYTLSFEDAGHFLQLAKQQVDEQGTVTSDSIRDWIRSEAEAAIWWPFASPSISDGPYAQIDIGAGTTNISIFRIVAKHSSLGWQKVSVSFFGATSPPVGMDAFDKAIAEWKGVANPLEWRGREDEVLFGNRGNQLVAIELQQIHEAYGRTIRKAFQESLQSHQERRVWGEHKIFFLGGGSLVDCVVKGLCRSPLDHERRLKRCELGVPSDLRLSDGTSVPEVMFPHVAVAYGLSVFSAELPDVEMPSQVPPMAGPSTTPDSNPERSQLIQMDEWRY